MNPATALATTLVDELLRCGLTELVLAPGSRSAPLALAAHAAHTENRLRLHVRIDERSAAYLALGLAKVSGRPAAVVCSSGTATTNLHPAVVEASQSGVPLLVLTADRPPELRDTGANQTIDQVKLYGDAVRWFCEVGAPERRTGAAAYWRSLACRAWTHALGAEPGPVHLNLAFREPLIPDGHTSWPESPAGRPGGAPWTEVEIPHPGVAAEERETLPEAERGVLVLGDGVTDADRYVAAAERAGWPVFAEPTSGARYGPNAISTYHYLLDVPEFFAANRPDVVVTAGKPSLSRALLAFLHDAQHHVIVAPGGPGWPDPSRRAHAVLARGPRPSSVDSAVRGAGGEGEWITSWRTAERAARVALDAALDRAAEPSEPRLARDLAATLPDGALLLAASSMPIRDLDQTMRPRDGLTIVANRGASGIDGLVSTATGAALAHGGPACALLGDLAFLHDQNGLILGPEEARPNLAVVVVNNDGGGIFSLLPQAGIPEPFERVFGTPHGADLASVAAANHLPYAHVECMAELEAALAGQGLRIIEVRTDRAAGAELRTRLREAVHAALRHA